MVNRLNDFMNNLELFWSDLFSDWKKTALYWISYIAVPTIEPISKMFQAVELDFMKDFRDLGCVALNVCKESKSEQLI